MISAVSNSPQVKSDVVEISKTLDTNFNEEHIKSMIPFSGRKNNKLIRVKFKATNQKNLKCQIIAEHEQIRKCCHQPSFYQRTTAELFSAENCAQRKTTKGTGKESLH